ncbi:MAG: class I SAM-dependent methyltransferase [Planctomycetota bacterium]|nr:class I SAM-dependent methyltransferase [Planctomycetota bacterium]
MNQLARIVRIFLPSRTRGFLRATHREYVFGRAMKQFLKDPGACAHPGNPIIIDLIYGWGNEGWSALDEYIAGCIAKAMDTDGPTLECGSGLSTILLGAIAHQRGQKYWALEHTPVWAARVQKYLDKYKLDSVVLDAKPLKDFGAYCWYDAPLETMPDSFSLIICDGPPGDTKGGRYGIVPVMRARLKPGCVILLDDAGRDEEFAIGKRWESELGTSFEFLGAEKPYIQLTVTGEKKPVEECTSPN